MPRTEPFTNYPSWIVFVSNLVSLLLYASGAFIIYQLGVVWFGLYLLYLIALEVRLLKFHCVNCYYYGKCCAFGQGKLSALFFRKGDPKAFAKMTLSWKDLLPDFLVALIPIVAGIVLLILDFSWPVLIALILIVILTTAGNSAVRGSLACRFCRQRELGCPAEKLFNKKK